MSLLLIPKSTCFRKCLLTFFTGICLWHTVQGYGFSPEWVFCWFLNLHTLENVSQHTSQGYVSDILYKDMASLLNESFVDSKAYMLKKMSHNILNRDMSLKYSTRIWLLSWNSFLLIPKPTCLSRFISMTSFQRNY